MEIKNHFRIRGVNPSLASAIIYVSLSIASPSAVMNKKLLAKTSGKKRRFLLYGSLNVIITNLVLQSLLLATSTSIATFLSQIVNVTLGFLFYGKLVFKVDKLQRKSALLYALLAIFIWLINWSGISLLSKFGFSPNLSAFLLVPILAGFSYTSQRLFIFKTKWGSSLKL